MKENEAQRRVGSRERRTKGRAVLSVRDLSSCRNDKPSRRESLLPLLRVERVLVVLRIVLRRERKKDQPVVRKRSLEEDELETRDSQGREDKRPSTPNQHQRTLRERFEFSRREEWRRR